MRAYLFYALDITTGQFFFSQYKKPLLANSAEIAEQMAIDETVERIGKPANIIYIVLQDLGQVPQVGLI